MRKEMKKYIDTFKEKMSNENINDEKIILIRSKTDNTFRFEISYKNGIIYKIETQGNFGNYINHKSFIDFLVNMNVKKEVKYNYLRTFLSEFSELYVKDIN